MIEALPKKRATNEYWAEALREVLTKPHLVEQEQNSAAQYRAITPVDIQTLARKISNAGSRLAADSDRRLTCR